MGRYLDIAEKALRQEHGNDQVITDSSKTQSGPPTRCEISEFSEISPVRAEWSELLENDNEELTAAELPVAIEMIEISKMRERGVIPDHYTAETECKHCGPVPIFAGCPPIIIGCPWCFNRIKGLPVPRREAD